MASPNTLSEFIWQITHVAERFCGLKVTGFRIDLVKNEQTLVVIDKAESGPATAEKLKELVKRLFNCHHQTYVLSSADEASPHVDISLVTQYEPW